MEPPEMDAAEREMLAGALRKTMASASGPALDEALAGLGWADLLAAAPDVAVPLVFGLLGETGAHAAVLNDVVLGAAGRPLGDAPPPLPYAGGRWAVWDRAPGTAGTDVLDGDLPLRTVPGGDPVPLAAARRALGWWLTGTGRAMLRLAREHALDAPSSAARSPRSRPSGTGSPRRWSRWTARRPRWPPRTTRPTRTWRRCSARRRPDGRR